MIWFNPHIYLWLTFHLWQLILKKAQNLHRQLKSSWLWRIKSNSILKHLNSTCHNHVGFKKSTQKSQFILPSSTWHTTAIENVIGIIAIEKAVRSVIDSQPQDTHIVGVEHAVHKAYALPVRHQLGSAASHRLQEALTLAARRRNGSMRLAHKKTVISHKLCAHFWSSLLSYKKEGKDKAQCFTHRFSK